MPDFPKGLPMGFAGWFDLDLLEAVFAAVIARVPTRDSLCPLLRDLLQFSFQAASAAQLAAPSLPPICRLQDFPRESRALSIHR